MIEIVTIENQVVYLNPAHIISITEQVDYDNLWRIATSNGGFFIVVSRMKEAVLEILAKRYP